MHVQQHDPLFLSSPVITATPPLGSVSAASRPAAGVLGPVATTVWAAGRITGTTHSRGGV